jgi:hypothetical protein
MQCNGWRVCVWGLTHWARTTVCITTLVDAYSLFRGRPHAGWWFAGPWDLLLRCERLQCTNAARCLCLLVRTWTCLPACLTPFTSTVHTPREWRCAHCWCMSVCSTCVQTFTNLQTFHSTWVTGVWVLTLLSLFGLGNIFFFWRVKMF